MPPENPAETPPEGRGSISLRRMRLLLGSSVLFAHLAALAIVFAIGSRHYQTIQLANFAVAITPLAAAYGLLFIKYVTIASNELNSERGRTVDLWPFLVQVLIVGGFCVVLVWASYISVSEPGRVELKAVYPGFIESVFGAYLATIFGRLFPPELVERSEGG